MAGGEIHRGEIYRLWLWWRRRWGAERRRATVIWLLAAAFVVLLLAAGSRVGDNALSEPAVHPSSAPALVELTLVHDAEAKGALCLDGSPAAYHLTKGFGSGSDKWIVHLEGGGWCLSLDSCSYRKSTLLGSSNYMERQISFVGILSSIPSQNPDFYNWNKVKVRYCDGASFSGYRESEVQNGTILFFRGQRIWEAIMGELLQKGLANSKQALLTGCSAGGLATFIHCDDFRALLPNVATVKCFADAGFFLNEKDISGKRFIQSLYSDVVQLQDVGNKFPDCVSRMEPSQCFFAEEIIKSVTTPFFILNAAYDFWQIRYILVPAESDPEKAWLRCKQSIQHCDSNQLQTLQGFRNAMLSSLSEFKQKKNGGMFIDSCFAHCQSIDGYTWHSPNSPRINNKTIAEAVGDWFFDRKETKEIDCPYPCNPTCYNVDLSQLSSIQQSDRSSAGSN
ncbi:pectin acetylesterase 5-like isoform X2 [Zingiber officinale]|uniref:pectin acetylesterase 5-like isoform X2 n=1 Tax=Zingiber officinale TaxID=94328 RepID=UPI001C4CD41A|nr:pectin acetylesterase 5-like isoform X2 [Zingiber officinale]